MLNSITGTVATSVHSSVVFQSPYKPAVPQLSVNQGTGFMNTVTTSIPMLGSSQGLYAEPSGRFLYAVNFQSYQGINQYAINQTTGAVSTITNAIGMNNSASAPTGNSTLVGDPSGSWLYVGQYQSGNVARYSINSSTGALSTASADVSVGVGATGAMTVDPFGRFLYIGDSGGNTARISSAVISTSSGAITGYTTINTYISNALTPSYVYGVAVDPTGRFVFSVQGSASTSTVQSYTVNQSSGALTTASAFPSITSGTNTVVCDPTGRYVYVAQSGGFPVSGLPLITQYTINQTNGTLTTNTSITIPNATTYRTLSMVIDPAGRYLYVTDITSGGLGWTYIINQTTGALTTASNNAILLINGNAGSPAPVIDPTGKYLFVAGYQTQSISQFSINNFSAANGVFTGNLNIGGTATLTNSTEPLNTKSGATGVVAHDYTTGGTWYHTSIAANFTANFTNVPTTDARSVVFNLVLVQGATAYIPSALQIDGSAQTIKWANGVTPTGNPNKVDIATFTLIRTGAAWAQVFGTYSSFG
jgi:6-phosphogluconolactonase (cycloisomerase 2 family)